LANGIEEIVHVSITAQDAAPSAPAFNKLLFAAYHDVGSELIRDYTSLTSLESDFEDYPAVLAAANAFFSQNPHGPTLSIGRLTTARAKVYELTPVIQNSTAYTIRINGDSATYTSDTAATGAEVTGGLKTQIDALAVSGLTVTEDDTKVTLTSTAGVWFSLGIERLDLFSTVVETTSGTDIDDELTAIAAERDDWYGVALEHQSEGVINAISEWTEARTKIYVVSSSNSDIIGSGTTDAASDAQGSTYNRTAVGYNHAASEDFPEIRWMSSRFPNDPGSETWNFKRLSGAEASRLSGTQVTNLKDKNAWCIRTLGGLNLTFGSKMASGRYIDVQLGLDWLQAQMETDLFALLANNPKVPYTDAGLAMIEGVVRAVMQRAIGTGFIADDENLNVTITPVTEQASSDRANRIVRGVKFFGRLAGAVEEMFVSGVVFP
jgi:hypothetical protein